MNTEPYAAAGFTRRRLVAVGGVSLVAVSFIPAVAAEETQPTPAEFPHVEVGPIRNETVAGVKVGTLNGGTKPIYVARKGSKDPVEHSVADTLFWGDIMMEHGLFFAMLMPGAELAQPRAQAEDFQKKFKAHLDTLRASTLKKDDYAAFNGKTRDLVRQFIDYKQRMHEAQASGGMHSLVWPSFFDHTRKEAERFAKRLDQLSGGDAAFARAEVLPFWSDKMAEHALFVAHLLDQDETALIEAAEKTSATFAQLEGGTAGASDNAMHAVESIIDFKTAAAKGIEAGKIKSIIPPALADHVRREAIRFKDELGRATA